MMAFFSASSVGTLPLNMECTEKLGADREVASFVLPLGATINIGRTVVNITGDAFCAIVVSELQRRRVRK